MTVQQLRAACAMFALTAPVTIADCHEIFDDLRPRLPAGLLLDVVRVDERTIRVAVTGAITEAIEIQAQS